MKSPLALLAIALLGVGLSACGAASTNTGSASQTSSNATATSGIPARTASSTPAGTSASGASSADVNAYRFSPTEVRNFETFGHMADGPSTQAIAAAVKRYYVAAAADDGAQACRLLYSGVARAAADDYGQSIGPRHLRGKNCAMTLSLLFNYREGRPAADLAAIEVTSVRIGKDHAAVALLRAPKMALGEIYLQHEDGSWRILQPLGNSLP